MSNENVVLARNTKNAPCHIGIQSQTVAFSHYNNLSAQLPVDPQSGQLVKGDIKAQALQCFENIKAIVNSIDHVMSDVVRITIFLTNIKDADRVSEVYKTYFPTYVPTLTVLGVAALPMKAQVSVEALLSHGEGSIPEAPQSGDLIKLTHQTLAAPVSPLSSQTVAFSHYNNLSAQLPINPQTGRLVIGGIKEQTLQCLKNIKTILTSIDVPFDDIVKINLFLTDLSDLEVVKEVYRRFFPDSGIARAVNYMPALTIVEVAGLQMGADVQIEAVVSHGDGTPPQKIEDRHGLIIEANNTIKAPLEALSSQTVAFSHYNHISAQLPIDPKTGARVEGGIKDQVQQCLENMKAIIESVDHVIEDVVKINIYLKDIDDLKQVDEVYKTFFIEGLPARKVVGVRSILNDALVQIDAVVGNAEGTPPLL